MKERIEWIDIIKFVGIFLVILGHSISAANKEFEVFRNFIYSFHMPLFIFISGYLYRKRGIANDIITLLFPYFIYQLTNALWILKSDIIHLNFNHAEFITLMKGLLLGNGYATGSATPPSVPCWFIIALFWIKIFWGLIEKCSEKMKAFIVIVLALSVYLVTHKYDFNFSIDSACQLIPFFWLGTLLKQRFAWIKLTASKYLVCWILLTFSFSYINGRSSANINLYGMNACLYYITAMCGILMCITFSKLPFLHSNKFIVTISSGTIEFM